MWDWVLGYGYAGLAGALLFHFRWYFFKRWVWIWQSQLPLEDSRSQGSLARSCKPTQRRSQLQPTLLVQHRPGAYCITYGKVYMDTSSIAHATD